MGRALKKEKPQRKVPHILLVIGDEQKLDDVFGALSDHGYQVSRAMTVKGAVDLIKRKIFDLIMLDPISLGNEGFSLLKTVRTHAVLSKTPAMVVTKEITDKVKHKCKRYKTKHMITFEKADSEHLHEKIIDILVNEKGFNYEDAKGENGDSPASRNKLLRSISQKLQQEEIQLPSAPKLLGKIINMLNDDSTSTTAIADLIEKEPTVSTRILKAANASAFADKTPCKTTHDAVQRLGLKKMMNYVMIINNAQFFSFEEPIYKKIREELWKHSLQVAVCAKYIGEHVGFSLPDSLFTYGLLHDIGKLSLLRVIQELPQDEDSTDEESIWLCFKKFHTQFGSTLLHKWAFPQEFVEVAKSHHDAPIKGVHGKYLVITGFANIVIHELDKGVMDETQMSQLLRTPHAQMLKINQSFMKGLEEELEEEMKVLTGLI
jgi:putative nucleotidyltransferase with HDIG domain